MKLTISNKNQEIEVTEDLSDAYLDKGHVFLDPDVKDNGILKALKKSRILLISEFYICVKHIFRVIVLGIKVATLKIETIIKS